MEKEGWPELDGRRRGLRKEEKREDTRISLPPQANPSSSRYNLEDGLRKEGSEIRENSEPQNIKDERSGSQAREQNSIDKIALQAKDLASDAYMKQIDGKSGRKEIKNGRRRKAEEASARKEEGPSILTSNQTNFLLHPLDFPPLGTHNGCVMGVKRGGEEKAAIVKDGETVNGPKRKLNQPISIDLYQALQLAVASKVRSDKKKRVRRLVGAERVKKKGKTRERKRLKIGRIRQAIQIGRLSRLDTQQSPELSINEQIERMSARLTASLRFAPTTSQSSSYSPQYEEAKKLLHSRKFRPYCTNMRSSELRESVGGLMLELRGYQERAYERDPLKARGRRRYVCGFNQALKYLAAGLAKLIIIATNLDANFGEPVYNLVNEVERRGLESGVGVVYCGTLQDLAYWTLKKSRVSIIAILYYQGAEKGYNRVIEAWKKAREEYEKALNETIDRLLENSPQTTSQKSVEKEMRERVVQLLSESHQPHISV